MPDQVVVNVRFRRATPFAWTQAAWSKTSLEILLDHSIEDLTSEARSLSKQKVLADARLTRPNLCVVLHTRLIVPGSAWGPINLDQEVRIESVRNLFRDPTSINKRIRVVVFLELRKVAAGKRQDCVCFPARHIRPEYYRIGHVSLPVDDYPEKLARRRHGDAGPSYTWALVTWFNQATESWDFRRVHAYDFDDYCIGDVNEDLPWNTFKWGTECHFLGPYTFVYEQNNSKARLLSTLEGLISEGSAGIAPGVPFLPKFSFNEYVPTEHGMGLNEWPRDGIDVVVRCVNHLGKRFPELERVSFPRDIHFVVDENDGPQDVVRYICESINTAGHQDGYVVDSSMLFSKRHWGRWKMELWCMPQLWEEFKMFRYTRGSLADWLDSSQRVRVREKRIYVEAHFVMNRNRGR